MTGLSNVNVLGTFSCLIINLLLVEAKSVNSSDCYNSIEDIHPYLVSKPQNQLIHGDIERPEGCTPLQIWMTARHGTRYSSSITKQQLINLEDFRDLIISNHEDGRGQMCSDDLTNLTLWQKDPNFHESKTDTLNYTRNRELHLLSKRVKDVFPDQSNDPKSYNFKASIHDQAISSLISLVNTLLNTSITADYKDDGLRERSNCPGWQKEHSREEQMTEFRKFKDGPHVRQALQKISQRLGFSKTVGFNTINMIYETCRYETASNPGNISVWCTVFSKEDLMVFEYLSDLDDYYCCGPGNRLNKKMSCGILKKLFNIFSQMVKENESNQPNGVFNTNEAQHVQSLLTLLKVYHPDEPLLASNYESLRHRLFNTSFINSFTSNVVAILYRCDNITMPNQVQFHVGENPAELPDCKGHSCDWKYLKREFGPILDDCDAILCDLPRENTMTSASSTCEDSYLRYLLPMIFVSVSYHVWF